jgi:hypothetical protein
MVMARKRPGSTREPTQSHKAAALKVCDMIIAAMRERFSFVDHLEASALEFTSKFSEFHKSFPTEAFETTIRTFPMLQADLLKTMLEIIYSRKELWDINGSLPLLKFFIKTNMQDVIPQKLIYLK